MPKPQQRMPQSKSKLLPTPPPPPPPPQLHRPAPMVVDRCLHCDQPSRDIQVRCDECGNFICTNCHWCHEFQGNHEIRVCGFCDGFFCKDCDEMDQCDDCQETVCGNCSTLLTCKFCGGGLCEECATACGRCGIVLCRRDAKFAVECDTCRMSYCLVCLAGTPKDPCVRCGQRPTKRMEQLVHLRLKSIYKAFSTAKTDQSAANQLAQEKADAAAAELLAEIEQEEEAKECKKNTKKKKKKKPDTPISLHNHRDIHCRDHRRDRSRRHYAEQDILERSGHPKEPSILEPLMNSAVDPLEEELAALVDANDSQGLERLLTSVKGVPGRAAFRKNAKKALKKMRSLSDEPADEEPLELFMEAVSPKLDGSLRPDEMLRLISDSKRSRGGYECVMYMAPSIVGWVIGKGGQRIRDMMDESGARIWIDQDSMNANAPRIVYVSGQRDNVDTAISAIQELIAAAPAMASPRTPILAAGVSDAGLSSAPAIPDATNAESPPSLKPRCKAKLTCAPRFVPLLIGKRGWTIKKIQDTTGAKVDIDQTASPRQITISGREDAVDEAKLMVEDVLNYPHAYPLETDTGQQELDLIPVAERLDRTLEVPSAPTESPPTESLVPSGTTPPQSPTRASPVVIERPRTQCKGM